MRRVALLGAPALGTALWLLFGGTSLAPEARALAGVLSCVVFWCAGEAMPLAVCALLGSSACVLLGVASAKRVFAPYADPVIFLFLGSFWIAKAMSAHGLDRRIALRFLSKPGVASSPRRLLMSLGGVAAFVSLWVSNTATVAMLLPIVLGMLEALPEDARRGPLPSRLLLMLAFAASIGGLGTPVGTPPNLIGIGMLERLAGVRIGFLEWMSLALPIVVLALAFLFALLGRGLAKSASWPALESYLGTQSRRLGPMRQGERNALLALGSAAALWMFAAERVPEGVAAVLASSLLFLLPAEGGKPTLSWEQASGIDWETLLLFGGGMSLGQLLFDTRLAEWAGSGAAAFLGLDSGWSVAALAAAVALATSESASNTASANVAVPTALALARSAGVEPLFPALAATLAASFGFLLPISTPPNALVYGTGRVPLREMMRLGALLDLCGLILILAVLGARF